MIQEDAGKLVHRTKRQPRGLKSQAHGRLQKTVGDLSHATRDPKDEFKGRPRDVARRRGHADPATIALATWPHSTFGSGSCEAHQQLLVRRSMPRTCRRQRSGRCSSGARLLDAAAHELRDPLAPIRIAAEMLGGPVVGTPDASRAEVVVAPHATGPLRDQCRQHCECKRPADVPLIQRSVLEMQRIVGSPLDNAAKHAHEGACIRPLVAVDTERVVMTPADDDAGLTGPMLHHIFESVGGTRTIGLHGGLGTGLALASALADARRATRSARSAESRVAANPSARCRAPAATTRPPIR